VAAKELYDYLDTVTPDVDQTLSIDPQAVLTELAIKNDVVHYGDDDNEEVISLSGNKKIMYIVILYNLLNASDSGTVLMFWMDESYGDGFANSFKFDHPDGHTYVVRFDTGFERQQAPTTYSMKQIKLRVLGKVAD
jgi:hypothetical protein